MVFIKPSLSTSIYLQNCYHVFFVDNRHRWNVIESYLFSSDHTTELLIFPPTIKWHKRFRSQSTFSFLNTNGQGSDTFISKTYCEHPSHMPFHSLITRNFINSTHSFTILRKPSELPPNNRCIFQLHVSNEMIEFPFSPFPTSTTHSPCFSQHLLAQLKSPKIHHTLHKLLLSSTNFFHNLFFDPKSQGE